MDAMMRVLARMEPCSMVPDRDELMGRMRRSSRLPQYLITAMLTGAVQVTATESGGRGNNVDASGQAMLADAMPRGERERGAGGKRQRWGGVGQVGQCTALATLMVPGRLYDMRAQAVRGR